MTCDGITLAIAHSAAFGDGVLIQYLITLCSGYCAFVVRLPSESVATDTDAAATMTHHTPLGAVMMHRPYVPAQHLCLRMSIHLLAYLLDTSVHAHISYS